MISLSLLHDDPAVPTPPGGRTLDSTLPDFLFHVAACRTAWLTAKGLPSA